MTTGNTSSNLDGELHQAPSNQERPTNEGTWPDKDTLSTMQYADPTLTGVQQRVVPAKTSTNTEYVSMRKWYNNEEMAKTQTQEA